MHRAIRGMQAPSSVGNFCCCKGCASTYTDTVCFLIIQVNTEHFGKNFCRKFCVIRQCIRCCTGIKKCFHVDAAKFKQQRRFIIQHRKLTGAPNEHILENLKKLDSTGKNIEIRMIMIPEHNMSEEDLRMSGEFLAPLENISAVRLLAYHSLARSKFHAVGHPDTMPDVPSPTADDLERSAEFLRFCGVKHVINSLT